MKQALLKWVSAKHQGQLIRSTGKPYLEHLLFVAQKAGALKGLGFEIGLCHDLLEETGVTAAELHEHLLHFGYTAVQAAHITGCVMELTDVFTKKAFPDMCKKERKKLEAIRLAGISADAQTVKYADLIYNIRWMLRYDQVHAAKYIAKKQQLVLSMTQGDAVLRAALFSELVMR